MTETYPDNFIAKTNCRENEEIIYYLPWPFALDQILLGRLRRHFLIADAQSERPLNRILLRRRKFVSWCLVEKGVLRRLAQMYADDRGVWVRIQGADGRQQLIRPRRHL